nr:unnamed protein product [Ananas comosus var. bracteatus]
MDEVLIDGWFHTGDIGEWQQDGAMKIIDRKKNIFKLSQGEYVAVEHVESAYMQCPLIASVWVYGNSFESFLVGVAVPERKPLEDWAASNNVIGNFEEICKHPKAKKHILDELNNTGRKHEVVQHIAHTFPAGNKELTSDSMSQLKGFEMLKAVYLETAPFDIERGLITPTFKLKRPQLLKYYKECIDGLYQEAKGSATAC